MVKNQILTIRRLQNCPRRDRPQEIIELGTIRTGYTLQTQDLIVSSSDILGGTPVFAGTRVPIKNLTDYLEAGDTLDAFLDDFPSVSREQAVAFLERAKDALLAQSL